MHISNQRGIPWTSIGYLPGTTKQNLESSCTGVFTRFHHLTRSGFGGIGKVCMASFSNKFPEHVKHLNEQVRLIASYGLNGGVLWLCRTNGALYFFCKDEFEVYKSAIRPGSRVLLI